MIGKTTPQTQFSNAVPQNSQAAVTNLNKKTEKHVCYVTNTIKLSNIGEIFMPAIENSDFIVTNKITTAAVSTPALLTKEYFESTVVVVA